MAVTTIAGLFAGVATILHLQDAKRLAAIECDQVKAELDAFESFAERIASLSATTSKSAHGPPLMDSPASTDLGDLKDAYRDTVMAVDHYDDEYGEPINTNMAAELGSDLVMALQGGNCFTPGVKQTLLSRTRGAAEQRETFVDILEKEIGELNSAEKTFNNYYQIIENLNKSGVDNKSFNELSAIKNQLAKHESDCNEKLRDRQHQIQNTVIEKRTDTAKNGSVTLPEYLYGPLDVSYPLLADGLSVLDTLQESQKTVKAALATR